MVCLEDIIILTLKTNESREIVLGICKLMLEGFIV
jgi:hypothetical protein